MRWENEPQSSNVEKVYDEPRPYGMTQVTRNMQTGTITSLNPTELNIQCPVAMRESFSKAAFVDLWENRSEMDKSRDDVVVVTSIIQQTGPEPARCKFQTDMFKADFERAGLGIKFNAGPARGGILFAPGEGVSVSGFWAGSPAPGMKK